MKAFATALAALTVAAAPCVGSAQSLAGRPITIVGATAGGPGDLMMRRIAPVAEKSLGTTIVIDNKAGAQNSIAAQTTAKAPPDGHTIYFGVVTTFHPLFIKNNYLDALASFTPIGNLATASTFVFISAKAPFVTLPQMVAYAKANPGKLNHGSVSITNEIQMKILAEKTGITFTQIPYKTIVQEVAALANDEIDIVAATSLGSFVSFAKAGTVRIMMVVGPKRSPAVPDVPTSAELGLAGYSTSAFQGLWGPLGLPRGIVDTLNTAFVRAVKDPEVAQFIRNAAYEPDGSTPAEQIRQTEEEVKYWTEALRKFKYEPQ